MGKLFGKNSSVLARPSHEGGGTRSSGSQGRSIFGKEQKRLAKPSSTEGGKGKKQSTYRPPSGL